METLRRGVARALVAVVIIVSPGLEPYQAWAQTRMAAPEAPAPAATIEVGGALTAVGGINAVSAESLRLSPAGDLKLQPLSALPSGSLGSAGAAASRPAPAASRSAQEASSAFTEPRAAAGVTRGAPQAGASGFLKVLGQARAVPAAAPRASVPVFVAAAPESPLLAPSAQVLKTGAGARGWAEDSFAELIGQGAVSRGSALPETGAAAAAALGGRGLAANAPAPSQGPSRSKSLQSLIGEIRARRRQRGDAVFPSLLGISMAAGGGFVAITAAVAKDIFASLAVLGYYGGNVVAVIMNFPQIYTSLATGKAQNVSARTAGIGAFASLLMAINASADQHAFFAWQNLIGGMGFLAVLAIKRLLEKGMKGAKTPTRALLATLGLAASLGTAAFLGYLALSGVFMPIAHTVWMGRVRVLFQIIAGAMFLTLLVPQNTTMKKSKSSEGVSAAFVWNFLLGSVGLGLFALHQAIDPSLGMSERITYLVYAIVNSIYIWNASITLRLIKKYAVKRGGSLPPDEAARRLGSGGAQLLAAPGGAASGRATPDMIDKVRRGDYLALEDQAGNLFLVEPRGSRKGAAPSGLVPPGTAVQLVHSPGIGEALLPYLDQASDVRGMFYSFTPFSVGGRGIQDVLKGLQARGAVGPFVLDRGQAAGRSALYPWLMENGFEAYRKSGKASTDGSMPPGAGSEEEADMLFPGVMHEKVWLITLKDGRKVLAWGSANPTANATGDAARNDENLVIMAFEAGTQGTLFDAFQARYQTLLRAAKEQEISPAKP